MKKYFYLSLIGSSIVFNSCSSSNDDNEIIIDPVGKGLLVSKVTTIYYDNPSTPETNIATFEYNTQGDLTKISSEGRTSSFEYSNGKPVKVNYYNADQTLDYYVAFSYNGDQLMNIKAIYTNPNFNRKSTYTYNSTGKLASSTLCQSEDCSNQIITTYAYNGDNISVETSTFSNSKKEFSYDDKLNPFTHTNPYLRILLERADVLSKNNYTTQKISYKQSDGSWTQSQNITYTIQYNNANLPVEVTGKEANGNNYVKYKYEYISL